MSAEPSTAEMVKWLTMASRRVPACFSHKETTLLRSLKDEKTLERIGPDDVGRIQMMWRSRQPKNPAS